MRLKIQLLKIVAIFSLGFFMNSCDNETTEIEKLPTAVEVMKADPSYSVFVKALDVTGIISLANAGSYTVFAANNTAFLNFISTNFPTGITEATLPPVINPNVPATPTQIAQQNELKRLMLNHIIGTAVLGKDLPTAGYLKSMSPFGTSTSITLSMYFNKTTGVVINGGSTNGGATVTAADINVSNGVVHKVDALLKLPTLVSAVAADKDLTTLLSVVTDPAQSAVLAQIASPGSNAQVFAPLNTAFTTALATGGYLNGKTPTEISKILRYHLVTAGSFTQTAVIGTSTGNINNGASSATSFLPSSATTDATVTTRAAVGSTSAFQTFRVEKGTVKIFENPALTIPASNMRTVNIHTSNGILHTIDRVLQPVLP